MVSMTQRRVGVLTIGQSPRPDFLAQFRERLTRVEILEAGALDNLSAAEVPEGCTGTYPLRTSFRDGSTVTVEEGFVEPLLQQALDRLEAEEMVDASCLLCAGSFPRLSGTRPLVKPFPTASVVLHSLGLRQIGIICPFESQRAASEKKWRDAGFDTSLCVHSPEDLAEACARGCLPTMRGIDAIVLDYVGHSKEFVSALQGSYTMPVLDLGDLAVALAVSIIQRSDTDLLQCRSGE